MKPIPWVSSAQTEFSLFKAWMGSWPLDSSVLLCKEYEPAKDGVFGQWWGGRSESMVGEDIRLELFFRKRGYGFHPFIEAFFDLQVD
jgi:hypothetical protein